MWEDARGNFHMLAHGHWDENGYLAFAEHPEGPWHFRHTPTYTNTITLTNGSKVTLKQRERPQVIFRLRIPTSFSEGFSLTHTRAHTHSRTCAVYVHLLLTWVRVLGGIQLLFDDAGRPSILYTGVAPPWAKFYGYTYTHAQRIAGSTQKYTP